MRRSSSSRRSRARFAIWVSALTAVSLFFGGYFAFGESVSQAGAAGRVRGATPYLHISAYFGKTITRAPFATNKVAITFDDGLSPQTLQVLRTLNRYGAKGTFFLVGRRCGDTMKMRMIVRQGSEIGNHTWEHKSLSGMTWPKTLDQISLTDSIIYNATGRWPTFVRARGGLIDDMGMNAVKYYGHLYVNWSSEGEDTLSTITSAQIATNVLATANGGSIILLHETNPRTAEALPAIIEGLQARGLVVTTVTDLLSTE